MSLEPKLYLSYDRKAMFCKNNRDLRITFDTNIRCRRYDLKMEHGVYGEEPAGAGAMADGSEGREDHTGLAGQDAVGASDVPHQLLQIRQRI